MNCLVCGFKNQGTVTYCAKCGNSLDFSAEEIGEALVLKEKEKRRVGMEYHARNGVIAATVLFLLSITAFILAGGAPREIYEVPPACEAAEFVVVQRPIDSVLGQASPGDLFPIIDCRFAAP